MSKLSKTRGNTFRSSYPSLRIASVAQSGEGAEREGRGPSLSLTPRYPIQPRPQPRAGSQPGAPAEPAGRPPLPPGAPGCPLRRPGLLPGPSGATGMLRATIDDRRLCAVGCRVCEFAGPPGKTAGMKMVFSIRAELLLCSISSFSFRYTTANFTIFARMQGSACKAWMTTIYGTMRPRRDLTCPGDL